MKTLTLLVSILILAATLIGCSSNRINIDDYNKYPVILLCEQDLAVIGNLASHPWFAWSYDGYVWSTIEVFAPGNISYPGVKGNIYYVSVSVIDDIGRNWVERPKRDGKVRASITEAQAVAIIQVIMDNWERYPFADQYSYYPGPNSNTFIQYLIDKINEAKILDKPLELGSMAHGSNYGK